MTISSFRGTSLTFCRRWLLLLLSFSVVGHFRCCPLQLLTFFRRWPLCVLDHFRPWPYPSLAFSILDPFRRWPFTSLAFSIVVLFRRWSLCVLDFFCSWSFPSLTFPSLTISILDLFRRCPFPLLAFKRPSAFLSLTFSILNLFRRWPFASLTFSVLDSFYPWSVLSLTFSVIGLYASFTFPSFTFSVLHLFRRWLAQVQRQSFSHSYLYRVIFWKQNPGAKGTYHLSTRGYVTEEAKRSQNGCNIHGTAENIRYCWFSMTVYLCLESLLPHWIFTVVVWYLMAQALRQNTSFLLGRVSSVVNRWLLPCDNVVLRLGRRWFTHPASWMTSFERQMTDKVQQSPLWPARYNTIQSCDAVMCLSITWLMMEVYDRNRIQGGKNIFTVNRIRTRMAAGWQSR